MAQTFLNCESTYDLTNVPAAMYDRKTAARTFDTFHVILQSLSLKQSLPKDQNTPIWRIGNREVNLLVPTRRQTLGSHSATGFALSTFNSDIEPHYGRRVKRYRPD